MEPDSPQILYLNTAAGDRIQAMTLAGIRRYAGALGWDVRSVPWQESRPEDIAPLLGAHRPVAGCVVECSDGNSHLPPRLFGRVPVVYLHAAPSLYGGRIVRVSADNEAVARAAFRELSAGHPTAFAAVGVITDYSWSRERLDAFSALCAEAGKPCRVFDIPGEKPLARVSRLPGWIAGLQPHTAIFAANDFAAAEVANAAITIPRSIPRELTLLGVDDNQELCESMRPALSSIRIDHERAGFAAARMIGERITARAERGMTPAADAANDAPLKARNSTNSSLRTWPASSLPAGRASSLEQAECGCAIIGPLLVVRRRSTGGAGRREKFILEAVEIIRREACDGLTASNLLSRFKCSRSLFNLRFREATGHSVLDEIQHVRLEKALALLSGTDTAIGAIADFCGFGSGVELRHLFRARMKMSLREWRKRNASK